MSDRLRRFLAALLIAGALGLPYRAVSAEDRPDQTVDIELKGIKFRIPKDYVAFYTTEKASIGERAGVSLYATWPTLDPHKSSSVKYDRQQVYVAVEHPLRHSAKEDLSGWRNISQWSHVGKGKKPEKWNSGELIKGDRDTAQTKTWVWDMYRMSPSDSENPDIIFCSQVRPTATNTTCQDAFLYKDLIIKINYASEHLPQWLDIRKGVQAKLERWSDTNSTIKQ